MRLNGRFAEIVAAYSRRSLAGNAGGVQRSVGDSIAATKADILQARSKKGPTFQKNAAVVELILTAFKQRGSFYHDGVRSYLFVKDTRALVALDLGEPGLELLLVQYGLYPNEDLSRCVFRPS